MTEPQQSPRLWFYRRCYETTGPCFFLLVPTWSKSNLTANQQFYWYKWEEPGLSRSPRLHNKHVTRTLRFLALLMFWLIAGVMLANSSLGVSCWWAVSKSMPNNIPCLVLHAFDRQQQHRVTTEEPFLTCFLLFRWYRHACRGPCIMIFLGCSLF